MFSKLNKIKALATKHVTLDNAKALASATVKKTKAFADWCIEDVKQNPLAWVTALVFLIMLAALGVQVVDMATLETLWAGTVAIYAVAGTLVLGFTKALTNH